MAATLGKNVFHISWSVQHSLALGEARLDLWASGRVQLRYRSKRGSFWNDDRGIAHTKLRDKRQLTFPFGDQRLGCVPQCTAYNCAPLRKHTPRIEITYSKIGAFEGSATGKRSRKPNLAVLQKKTISYPIGGSVISHDWLKNRKIKSNVQKPLSKPKIFIQTRGKTISFVLPQGIAVLSWMH